MPDCALSIAGCLQHWLSLGTGSSDSPEVHAGWCAPLARWQFSRAAVEMGPSGQCNCFTFPKVKLKHLTGSESRSVLLGASTARQDSERRAFRASWKSSCTEQHWSPSPYRFVHCFCAAHDCTEYRQPCPQSSHFPAKAAEE